MGFSSLRAITGVSFSEACDVSSGGSSEDMLSAGVSGVSGMSFEDVVVWEPEFGATDASKELSEDESDS